MDYKKIVSSVKGLNRRFPNGNDPFRAITRLAEEAGELAEQVNIFEGTGVKEEKFDQPDPRKLSKEVMDVMRAALSVAVYYGVEDQVEELFEEYYQRMAAEGLID